jgi:hypothetical protein
VSNNRFAFSGLDELKAALRTLPADLAGEASHIVEAAANAAEADIKAGYPVRTGDLRDHVLSQALSTGAFSAGIVVKNTSKLAYIAENGTQARHTALGANRGSMPPLHVFIPAVIKRRRVMYAQLKDLCERKGIRVTGDA